MAHPWHALRNAGFAVEFASPRGGTPPLDGIDAKDPVQNAFLADPATMAALNHSLRPDQVDPSRYVAIYYAGGHGVMWDLAGAPAPVVTTVLSRPSPARRGRRGGVPRSGRAFVGATKVADGTPRSSRGTGSRRFSTDEERAVGLAEVVPFLLESKLTEFGGRHERGEMWKPHAVRDGRLVTGQNPASSRPVAEQVLAALLSAP